MKKLKSLIIIMMLSLPLFAYSLEWQTANQVTVGWLAVTMLNDGSPIPANNQIKYNVYLANAISDPDKTNPSLITQDPISTLQYTITLGIEGKFFVGVQSLRYNEAGELVSQSTINWSDTNGEFTPNPFGVRFYLAPAMAKGQRIVNP